MGMVRCAGEQDEQRCTAWLDPVNVNALNNLGLYQRTVLKLEGVLSGQQYEAHEVDISAGKYPGLPYHYFGVYDLSVDGPATASGPDRRTIRWRG